MSQFALGIATLCMLGALAMVAFGFILTKWGSEDRASIKTALQTAQQQHGDAIQAARTHAEARLTAAQADLERVRAAAAAGAPPPAAPAPAAAAADPAGNGNNNGAAAAVDAGVLSGFPDAVNGLAALAKALPGLSIAVQSFLVATALAFIAAALAGAVALKG